MFGDYETSRSQSDAVCDKSYGGGFVGPFACSAATVGDMEDCTQDRIDAAAAALPSISECELLDEEDIAGFQDTIDVASCRHVATVCAEDDEQVGDEAFLNSTRLGAALGRRLARLVAAL